jgi:pimeloyl-ACP methyl ester carboxylesterase
MSSLLLSCLALGAVPLARATAPHPFEFPYGAYEPVPFHVSVDPDFVEHTRQKAKTFRPTVDLLDGDVSNPGWVEGVPSANLSALRDFWVDEFDWAETEEQINGNFSHYAVTIPEIPDWPDEVPVHFIHEKSEVEGAIPVVLLHGWPSTSLEWSKVIHELTAPSDPDAPAFHVVAPDIPGFGFSPAPRYSGYGPQEMGHTFHLLMQQLGYEEYGIASTDLGWFAALFQVALYPEAITGHFTDFWFLPPTAEDYERYANNQTSAVETGYITSFDLWIQHHNSYNLVHQGTPLSFAQSLNDSPVGFASWVWHLMNAVSNGFEYSLDEIIRDTFLLYVPGVFGNIRSYKEIFLVSRSLPRPCGNSFILTRFNRRRSPFRRPRCAAPSRNGSWATVLLPH